MGEPTVQVVCLVVSPVVAAVAVAVAVAAAVAAVAVAALSVDDHREKRRHRCCYLAMSPCRSSARWLLMT